MGTYVDKIASPPFEWGDDQFAGTGSELTKDLVEAKVNASLTNAQDMLALLVGSGGNGGYLGALNAIIDDYSSPAIDAISVSVPDLGVSVDSRPSMQISTLDTDFPTFDKTSPALVALPTIDLSALTPANIPAAITTALTWLETAHDTTLFDELMIRLIADLQTGATGLSAAVEQEIYDRALARQTIDNDRRYEEVDKVYSGSRWPLPSGAYVAGLKEVSDDIARSNLDINGKIMVEQAELAQKNSQFVIGAAKDLEAVLRDFTSKKNDRSLDYSKAVAAHALAIYAEAIKAYIAAAEANKAYVEVQVENLKASVEYNKGLVASFAAEAEAYGVIISAKRGKNEALIGAFDADVRGYDAETRAISEDKRTQIESYRLKIQNGDMQLRAAIASAENILGGYTSESSLREKVAEAMANIAMQSVASAYGSVNASVGLSHQTGRSESESYTHGENRSIGYDINNSLPEGHSFEEAAA